MFLPVEPKMRLNTRQSADCIRTHEGAPAKRISPMQQLRRLVSSAFLWEGEFYVSGKTIADQIAEAAEGVSIGDLAALAVELRHDMKLRHVPLLLLSILSRRGAGQGLVADTIERVISRPDELCELLAIHARLNQVGPDCLKKVIPAQMKKGLARAFEKFDAYQLGKYNRSGPVRLRDVMFLTHPKTADTARAAAWGRLIDGTLESPDTWEVALSGGADKAQTFSRLIAEGKLGYLALLRNLRGMLDAGVDEDIIRNAILARKGAGNVLPFRFTAAARACPRLEAPLDEALCEVIHQMPRLDGRTIVLVDVSYSMNSALSERSGLTRMDAAATLGAVIHGDLRVFTFSNDLVEVPARRGMAGVDAIIRSQPHGETDLRLALSELKQIPHDRLIVITDEQARSSVPDPVARRAYMINVASNRNGVGYGTWTHIDGFSENVLRFIHEAERLDAEDC
jgi:60 kDa SS-A/Ro ribonucleoprotein